MDDTKNNSTEITSSQKLHFQGIFRHQYWSLPDTIIYFATKNPSSAKAFKKLIKTCKYFYAQNPIFVIKDLLFNRDSKLFEAYSNELQKLFNVTNVLSTKLWVIKEFRNSIFENYPFHISSIIPHIYKIDAKCVNIKSQNLTFNEFLFLFSNAKDVTLYYCIIKDENDSIVPLEKLITFLPKVKYINFSDNPEISSITENTAKEILKIPQFSELHRFSLFKIPDSFDADTLFTYIKKNKYTIFYLQFLTPGTEAKRNQIEAFIDEIGETENHDYKIPFIYYLEIPENKLKKLRALWRRQFGRE